MGGGTPGLDAEDDGVGKFLRGAVAKGVGVEVQVWTRESQRLRQEVRTSGQRALEGFELGMRTAAAPWL